MLAPGSQTPPSIRDFSSACNITGTSNTQFTISKNIAGDSCTIIIENENGVTVWQDVILDYQNSIHFFVYPELANGPYILSATGSGGTATKDFTVDCQLPAATLKIEGIQPGNASKSTTTDATAVATLSAQAGITVETHLGDFNWKAAVESTAGSYTATYGGLGAGLHTLYARDSNSNTAKQTFNTTYTKVYGCTNRAANNFNENATDDDGSCILPAPVIKPVFAVPLMNSLRFVEKVDLLNTMPTLDNRLYNTEEDWLGITQRIYYQKVNRADNLTTQFKSNYDNHTCEIRDAQTDNVILAMPAELKQQNIGVSKQYNAWLTANGTDATTSRLYFNGGEMPIVFINGDKVEILNANPAAINREYNIKGNQYDTVDSIPYIVIDLAYPVTNPTTNRINIIAQATYDTQTYNVFEFTPVWGNKPNGIYYCKITATRLGFATAEYNSEYFALYAEHPGTNLIEYRNYDDDLDLVFTEGLICCIRVESECWQRVPAGTRKTDRTTSGKLRKLQGQAQRKFKFNTFRLPPWLHEKLGFLFDLDYVALNGVEVQSEDGYSEPSYVNRYSLSNGSILLEQVGSFIDQNGNDLGKATGGGKFLLANGKFIKV